MLRMRCVAAARVRARVCVRVRLLVRVLVMHAFVLQVLEDDASNAALQRMRDGDGSSSSSSSSSRMDEVGSMKGSVRPQVDPLLLKFQTRVSFNPDQVQLPLAKIRVLRVESHRCCRCCATACAVLLSPFGCLPRPCPPPPPSVNSAEGRAASSFR